MELSLSDIIIDPEFKALIPPLSPSERRDLEANLLDDGCLSPLAVWQDHNVLLDGHNRHEICGRHNIPCKIHQIALETREDAKAWIIRHQLGRRNLTESQRAMFATELEEVYSRQARQRQRVVGGDRGNQHSGGKSPLCANVQKAPPVHAAKKAAADASVSPRLVSAAKKVKAAGTEKLQRAVMTGHASVSAAAEVATLPVKEQDRLASQGGKAIAEAAQEVRRQRRQRRAAKGISPKAMKPVRDSQPLPPKTALEIPHDPLWAAKALISTFDREFIVGLVQALTNHLQGERQ